MPRHPDSPTDKEIKRAIGERLKLARMALNLKAADVCREFGLTSSRWSQYESGRSQDITYLWRFATRWNVSFEWLLRGDMSILRADLVEPIKAILKAREAAMADPEKKALPPKRKRGRPPSVAQ